MSVAQVGKIEIPDQADVWERKVQELVAEADRFQSEADEASGLVLGNAYLAAAQVVVKEQERHEGVLRILRSGYDLVSLPEGGDWTQGWVRDPRPFRGSQWDWAKFLGKWYGLKLYGLGVVLAEVVGVIIGLVYYDFSTAVMFGTEIPLLWILITLIGFGVVSIANNSALEKASIPDGSYFLKVPPPTPAMEAYYQAKQSGLFKRIKVVAPIAAFYWVVDTDPIIYAEAYGETFFIAQYDIELPD